MFPVERPIAGSGHFWPPAAVVVAIASRLTKVKKIQTKTTSKISPSYVLVDIFRRRRIFDLWIREQTLKNATR